MRPIRDGVGAAERSGRWLMALEYMMHVNRLIVTTTAVLSCGALARIGFVNPPRLLCWLAQRPKAGRAEEQPGSRVPDGPSEPPNELVVGSTGRTIRIPRQDNVDVEHEVRRLLQQHARRGPQPDEQDNRPPAIQLVRPGRLVGQY